MSLIPCRTCGLKPEAYHGRGWCYDCKPSPQRGWPKPCRRCGSPDDHWTERLCRRCHPHAPQRPESCRDCLAWGARRTEKWWCKACLGWQQWNPHVGACLSCQRRLHLNPDGACRLCWLQAKLIQERLPGRHRGPMRLTEFNRHGQQLFFANMGSSKNGYRPPFRPEPVEQPQPRRPRSRARPPGTPIQLDLFSQDPITKSWHRHGVVHAKDPRLAQRLDDAVVDHAVRHGWSSQKTHHVRTGMRILIATRTANDLPINASDVERLKDPGLPIRPTLAVLGEAGVLHEDRPATIEVWFERQIRILPDAMSNELRVWFDVLHRGSTTPPRSRPRHPATIKNRLNWSLPTLMLWAAAGHESLREISRDDILAVLPASGTPRSKLGDGLRSIFTTLKRRKLVFVNPMSRISVGNHERRTPLPAQPELLRQALNTPDATGQLLAALLIFHGLRPLELRNLLLTDLHDGRLHLPDRTIPLAEPVEARLATYLDERQRRWPNSINPHLFTHHVKAGTTNPVSVPWISDRVGTSAMKLRQARIVDEVLATDGDLRRICDFFGVTMTTAEHYASLLNHPDLVDP